MAAAQDFDVVLKGKYPAKAHSKRVVQAIRDNVPGVNGVIYLQGRMLKLQEDSDSPEHYRQRRYFYYLTGCNLADCHFALDMQTLQSVLFIPPVDPDEVVWSGLPLGIRDALDKYDVDEVKFTSDVNATLAYLANQSSNCTVFAIAGHVPDNVTFLEFADTNFSHLKAAIDMSRVIKDEYEVAAIRKANYISAMAHTAVMQRAKHAVNEQELEAAFFEKCISHGAKEMAYSPIIASGKAAATLHYVHNNAPLESKLNVLVDAGAEWNNYASDITRTFPLSGTFTKESRDIYDIVHKMQSECISMIRAGMLWDEIHVHAHKVVIDGLLAIGILRGSAEEIFKARTSAAFFPHGLGHYLGLDTHDVGGNPNSHDDNVLFRYLRLRGRVPAGSVVTVEPGIYFCDFIIRPYLDDAKHAMFINSSVLDKYWDVGGIRIEDDVLVTENGYENLTTLAKTSPAVESLCVPP